MPGHEQGPGHRVVLGHEAEENEGGADGGDDEAEPVSVITYSVTPTGGAITQAR